MKALDADTKEITAMAMWLMNGYGNEELVAASSAEKFGAASHLAEGNPESRDMMLAAGMLIGSNMNIQEEQQPASGLWQYVQAKT